MYESITYNVDMCFPYQIIRREKGRLNLKDFAKEEFMAGVGLTAVLCMTVYASLFTLYLTFECKVRICGEIMHMTRISIL